VPYKCESNEDVSISEAPSGAEEPMHPSGERVSNTWVTCLGVRDNGGKLLLILDSMGETHVSLIKGFGRAEIGPRAISLLVR
jgi:hypothetical protein